MNLKRFLLAITAVAMLAAVMANSASATVTAEGQWYMGATAPGTTLLEGTTKAITCSKGGSENLKLTGTVGAEATKLEATGIECVGAVIKNVGAHGFATGKLKFTGVSVVQPTGCTVASSIETEPLTAELYMLTGSTKPVIKFEPTTTGGNFATITIGGTCGAAGSRIVKGSVFGQATNATEVPAVTQSIEFSEAIDTAAGSALKFAGNTAHLSGIVNNTAPEAYEAH